MTDYEEITIDILQKHKGEYIQFGGNGIIDGLKLAPDKMLLWRIEELKIGEKGDVEGVSLHGYRRKKNNWLPIWRFNQTCRIFSKKEWSQLPIYVETDRNRFEPL